MHYVTHTKMAKVIQNIPGMYVNQVICFAQILCLKCLPSLQCGPDALQTLQEALACMDVQGYIPNSERILTTSATSVIFVFLMTIIVHDDPAISA